MTKGLMSFPEHRRLAIAQRRVKNSVRGNGFFGAQDFLDKQRAKALKAKPVSELSKEEIREAVDLHDRGKL